MVKAATGKPQKKRPAKVAEKPAAATATSAASKQGQSATSTEMTPVTRSSANQAMLEISPLEQRQSQARRTALDKTNRRKLTPYGENVVEAYDRLAGRQRAVSGQVLMLYYETGAEVKKLADAGQPAEAIVALAECLHYQPDYVRKCAQFAAQYTAKEAQVLADTAMTFAHIKQLLAVPDKHIRKSLEQQVIANRWSRDELANAIRAQIGNATNAPAGVAARAAKNPTIAVSRYRAMIRKLMQHDVEVMQPQVLGAISSWTADDLAVQPTLRKELQGLLAQIEQLQSQAETEAVKLRQLLENSESFPTTLRVAPDDEGPTDDDATDDDNVDDDDQEYEPDEEVDGDDALPADVYAAATEPAASLPASDDDAATTAESDASQPAAAVASPGLAALRARAGK